MKQFNFPTVILYGQGSLDEGIKRIARSGVKKLMLVTDPGLIEAGIINQVSNRLNAVGLSFEVFDQVSPNPTESNVELGSSFFKVKECDALLAVGGGSPMDVAKVIGIRATQKLKLEEYEDQLDGADKMDASLLPRIFAVPTTAGTGSEVGRSGVITMKQTGVKTIFFHPKLLPEIAILEPSLTTGLPKKITAATGLDALTHCLEAYFAPGFHPMADGIALEGINLVIKNLPTCLEKPDDLEARAQMLLAATMGATAFQKGLGMIHSMAHPLSSHCGLHHGLANALLLPFGIKFLEDGHISPEQHKRIERVLDLFRDHGYVGGRLSEVSRKFVQELGIDLGLKNYSVQKEQLPTLVVKAVEDVCHQTNMIPVEAKDFEQVLNAAYDG